MTALTDWHRQIAASIAAAHPLEGRSPALKPFTIRIGARNAPRLEFGCMARTAAEAIDHHICLATEGERVEALPVRSEAEIRNERYHQRNDAAAMELQLAQFRNGGLP